MAKSHENGESDSVEGYRRMLSGKFGTKAEVKAFQSGLKRWSTAIAAGRAGALATVEQVIELSYRGEFTKTSLKTALAMSLSKIPVEVQEELLFSPLRSRFDSLLVVALGRATSSASALRNDPPHITAYTNDDLVALIDFQLEMGKRFHLQLSGRFVSNFTLLSSFLCGEIEASTPALTTAKSNIQHASRQMQNLIEILIRLLHLVPDALAYLSPNHPQIQVFHPLL